MATILVEGQGAIRLSRVGSPPPDGGFGAGTLGARLDLLVRFGLRDGVELWGLLLVAACAATAMVAAAAIYSACQPRAPVACLVHRGDSPLWPSTVVLRCTHLCVFSPQSHLMWLARDLRMARQCWHCDTGRPFLLMC